MNQTLIKDHEIGHGIECHVYDVGDGSCYKRYRTEIAAKFAYLCAKKAADAGISPAVYEFDGIGYYTEIIYSMWYNNENRETYEKEINILRDKLEKLFSGRIIDLHADNVAINNNGDALLIDLGFYTLRFTNYGEILISKLEKTKQMYFEF